MRGEPNAKVEKMQAELEELGFDLGEGGVDGRFGEGTEAAIKKLQQRYGLRVDGIAGEQTLRMLKRLLDKRKKEHEKRVTTGEEVPSTSTREALELLDALIEREEAHEARDGVRFARARAREERARERLEAAVGKDDDKDELEALVKKFTSRGMPRAAAVKAARKALAKKAVTEAAVKYDPILHPRARTGRWIETLRKLGLSADEIEQARGCARRRDRWAVRCRGHATRPGRRAHDAWHSFAVDPDTGAMRSNERGGVWFAGHEQAGLGPSRTRSSRSSWVRSRTPECSPSGSQRCGRRARLEATSVGSVGSPPTLRSNSGGCTPGSCPN